MTVQLIEGCLGSDQKGIAVGEARPKPRGELIIDGTVYLRRNEDQVALFPEKVREPSPPISQNPTTKTIIVDLDFHKWIGRISLGEDKGGGAGSLHFERASRPPSRGLLHSDKGESRVGPLGDEEATGTHEHPPAIARNPKGVRL
jgi:hypothetical protein